MLLLFPLIAREWNEQCLHDASIICNDSPWVIPYCSSLNQQARSEQKHSLGEEKSVCCNSLLTVSMVKAHTSPKFLFLYYQHFMTIFQSCYCCSEISVGTFDWLVEAFCQKEKQQSIVKLTYTLMLLKQNPTFQTNLIQNRDSLNEHWKGVSASQTILVISGLSLEGAAGGENITIYMLWYNSTLGRQEVIKFVLPTCGFNI